MQRCLSGLRSTIGNRVMQECIRRFKSSSLRQQKGNGFFRFLFVLPEYRRGFEGGSRFARAKRFAYDSRFAFYSTAKTDIGNIGAGRAAKGANPLLCANKKAHPSRCVFLFVLRRDCRSSAFSEVHASDVRKRFLLISTHLTAERRFGCFATKISSLRQQRRPFGRRCFNQNSILYPISTVKYFLLFL